MWARRFWTGAGAHLSALSAHPFCPPSLCPPSLPSLVTCLPSLPSPSAHPLCPPSPPTLPTAPQLVREASRRVLGLRPFDVQLMGGMILHEGQIAEMRTGEGKTLVAVLPAFLNALSGGWLGVCGCVWRACVCAPCCRRLPLRPSPRSSLLHACTLRPAPSPVCLPRLAPHPPSSRAPPPPLPPPPLPAQARACTW